MSVTVTKFKKNINYEYHHLKRSPKGLLTVKDLRHILLENFNHRNCKIILHICDVTFLLRKLLKHLLYPSTEVSTM